MNISNTYDFLKSDLDPNKTYVIFCRHGHSVINEEERVGGSSELANKPLTKKGEGEAEDLGRNLAPFKDKITQAFTSPLIRAHQTCEKVLKTMGSEIQLQKEPALREKFFGEELDGQTKEVYEHYAAIEREETKGFTFSQKWDYTCSKLTKPGKFRGYF
jgi:broad specificity phosphatase PhoE